MACRCPGVFTMSVRYLDFNVKNTPVRLKHRLLELGKATQEPTGHALTWARVAPMRSKSGSPAFATIAGSCWKIRPVSLRRNPHGWTVGRNANPCGPSRGPRKNARLSCGNHPPDPALSSAPASTFMGPRCLTPSPRSCRRMPSCPCKFSQMIRTNCVALNPADAPRADATFAWKARDGPGVIHIAPLPPVSPLERRPYPEPLVAGQVEVEAKRARYSAESPFSFVATLIPLHKTLLAHNHVAEGPASGFSRGWISGAVASFRRIELELSGVFGSLARSSIRVEDEPLGLHLFLLAPTEMMTTSSERMRDLIVRHHMTNRVTVGDAASGLDPRPGRPDRRLDHLRTVWRGMPDVAGASEVERARGMVRDTRGKADRRFRVASALAEKLLGACSPVWSARGITGAHEERSRTSRVPDLRLRRAIPPRPKDRMGIHDATPARPIAFG